MKKNQKNVMGIENILIFAASNVMNMKQDICGKGSFTTK